MIILRQCFAVQHGGQLQPDEPLRRLAASSEADLLRRELNEPVCLCRLRERDRQQRFGELKAATAIRILRQHNFAREFGVFQAGPPDGLTLSHRPTGAVGGEQRFVRGSHAAAAKQGKGCQSQPEKVFFGGWKQRDELAHEFFRREIERLFRRSGIGAVLDHRFGDGVNTLQNLLGCFRVPNFQAELFFKLHDEL